MNQITRANVTFTAFDAEFQGVFVSGPTGYSFEFWNVKHEGQFFNDMHELRMGSDFSATDKEVALQAGIASGADYVGLCEDVNRGVN